MTTYDIEGWTVRDTLVLYPISDWADESTIEDAYTSYITQKRIDEEDATTLVIQVPQHAVQIEKNFERSGWIGQDIAVGILVAAFLVALFPISLAVLLVVFFIEILEKKDQKKLQSSSSKTTAP